MKKEKSIYNPNVYLQLHKSFNILQKRTIHFVVKQLQEELYNHNEQKQTGRPIEHTLFGDCYFHIPYEAIDPTNQDKHIRNALKGLKIPIDDKNFIGDFMLSAKREKGAWKLLFPEKTVRFLTDISKGVTPLQTVIYITAKSIYTIRLYELLMQYRISGKWYTTPEELNNLLGTPATYQKNYNFLKARSLETARKELQDLYNKKESEITFQYEEIRGGRGNKVQKLIFTIFWSEKLNKKEEETAKELQFVSDNLSRIMLNDVKNKKYHKANEEFINRALSKLVEYKQVKHFANKLEKRVLLNSKVEKNAKGALARYILENDFSIE